MERRNERKFIIINCCYTFIYCFYVGSKGFMMIIFEKELDVQELELHRKLCRINDIIYVVVEIEYYISKYRPATWFDPAEGGEIEDWNIKVIDWRFTEKQRKVIKESLDENAIVDAIWTHYDTNKSEPDRWY